LLSAKRNARGVCSCGSRILWRAASQRFGAASGQGGSSGREAVRISGRLEHTQVVCSGKALRHWEEKMNKGVVSVCAGFFAFLVFSFSLTSCQNEEKTESDLDLGELGDTPSVSSSKYCSTTLNFKDSTSVVLRGAMSFYRVLVRDNDDWNNHWSVHSTPEVVTMKVVYAVLFVDKSLRETAANQLANKGFPYFLQKVFSARLPILNRGINLSMINLMFII
jgi:hypothetical protein